MNPDSDGSPGDADDAVRGLLSLLGKTHTLSILYLFARDPGPWRFGEVRSRLGVPANTLSERLGELVEREMLVRQSFDESPPRVEYTATERTEDLKPAFAELYRWTRRHRVESTD